MIAKPLLILDSSPLITLALFPVHKPAIEDVLARADLAVVDSVAAEVTANPSHRDAKVIKALLDADRITSYPVPKRTAVDTLIEGYSRLDEGESDTIRLALTMPDATVVMDDEAAFVIATHFELSPVMLLDLLADWVKAGRLDKETALKIVSAVATRYSEAFVAHTKYKLGAG